MVRHHIVETRSFWGVNIFGFWQKFYWILVQILARGCKAYTFLFIYGLWNRNILMSKIWWFEFQFEWNILSTNSQYMRHYYVQLRMTINYKCITFFNYIWWHVYMKRTGYLCHMCSYTPSIDNSSGNQFKSFIPCKLRVWFTYTFAFLECQD